jgi:hypothetical protein
LEIPFLLMDSEKERGEGGKKRYGEEVKGVRSMYMGSSIIYTHTTMIGYERRGSGGEGKNTVPYTQNTNKKVHHEKMIEYRND